MNPPAPRRLRRWSLVLAAILGLMSLNLVPSTAFAAQGFENVQTPTVSGSGVIGTDFTASIDLDGTTPYPTMVVYSWYRVDTFAEVQSGLSPVLAASPALEGTGVYVIVTLVAINTQNYVTLNSAFSNTVRKAGFENVQTPTVSGSGVIGTEFTASLDVVGTTPVPASVTYTWHRSDTSAELQSGASATLAATADLEGTGVYVIVRLAAPNTQDYVTENSAFSNTVRKAGFESVQTPTVSGSGVIGTEFTAALDLTGTTPVPASVTYTWHRSDTSAELQSGASATLAATAELEGTGVYVIATLAAPNTQNYVTENSAFSNTVHKRSFTPGDAPTISGQHTLFGALTAQIDTVTWEPEPTTVNWQWFLADGTPVDGADQETLAMTVDLVGESVYAVATLRAADTVDYVIATSPSGQIAAPTLSLSGGTRVTAGSTVSFQAWGLLFNTEYTFELHSDPIQLGARTTSSAGTLDTTFALPANTPTGTHQLVVLLNGQEVGSVPVEVVREAVPVTPPAQPPVTPAAKPSVTSSTTPAQATLAHTGAAGDVWPGIGGAALLLLGGAVLLVRARRAALTRS